MKINIIVTLAYQGTHRWDDAPENVSFLKYPHRHLFHITAKKTVNHLDREIEIITLKNDILTFLQNTYPDCNFEIMSCEQIAVKLFDTFQLNYCSVLEDGENGAEVIA